MIGIHILHHMFSHPQPLFLHLHHIILFIPGVIHLCQLFSEQSLQFLLIQNSISIGIVEFEEGFGVELLRV
uniref:Uncharacterized protein n=1 Tax=Anguilla anguilla TaxID=7936 RepID=A0A0E9WAP5_ANGAN